MRAALSAIAAGIAVLAGAALLPVASLRWEAGFADSYDLAAPIPATAETVALGRALYHQQMRCSSCHGTRGRGDGPLAASLTPPPADLLLHAPQHPDGELFWYISRGSPGTAMPAWDSSLGEEDRWALVHYLRELAEGRP